MSRAAADSVERALAAVAEREGSVHAFVHLDPDRARAEADAAPDGPLAGVTVGVKDIFDTADMPTEYGCPAIYSDHRPSDDAVAVALLRAAGAVVLGKTVTAELAWFAPGATTNPHRATHTPGGSSSGSAAAVAAGMVHLAIGTQTAGSVIRPASFCGVVGYKPTFGAISTVGVKTAAPSLDTVGLFGRDVDIVDRARQVLTIGGSVRLVDGGPRFALVRTDQWDRVDRAGQLAVERAAEAVGAQEWQLPLDLVGLADAQPTVQAFEGVRSLAAEWQQRRADLSEGLQSILAWGDSIDADEYTEVLAAAALGRTDRVQDALFGDRHVLVTPAAIGEAPLGLDATGDPRCCRLWTLLGNPTVSVPGLVGPTGLPIGIQLVGRHHQDALLLDAAAAVQKLLVGPGGLRYGPGVVRSDDAPEGTL